MCTSADPGENVQSFKKTRLKLYEKLQQGSLKDSYIPRSRMTMERPQNSRLKLVAFNCDLDLESALLSYGFCTSSH